MTDQIEQTVTEDIVPLPELISGLTYIPDYLKFDEQRVVTKAIDRLPWLHDLKRRVQHYGYKYDYKSHSLDQSSYVGPLPDFVQALSEKLAADGHFAIVPDQAIANEYHPGQGISAHIDCTPCFNDTIASLTLGAGCTMDFVNTETNEKKSLFLEPGSLVILRGDSRYKWTHAIPARKSDIVNGTRIERKRRVSLTFRNVILTS